MKDVTAIRDELQTPLGQMIRESGREVYSDDLQRGTKRSELEATAGASGDEVARLMIGIQGPGHAEDRLEGELGECPACDGAAREAERRLGGSRNWKMKRTVAKTIKFKLNRSDAVDVLGGLDWT